MDIRIIKNAHPLKGSVYNNKYIFEIEYEPSDYTSIRMVRYFMYDVENNRRKELLPERKKYDVLKIKKLKSNPDLLFFSEIVDDGSNRQKINLCKYDLKNETLDVLYEYDDDLSEYNEDKKVRVFILNEFYMLFQIEYLRENLAGNYKGYFEFEQFLYCVIDKNSVPIKDNNFKMNGIENIKLMSNNMCLIKTGFNLLKDERYEKLEKSELSLEKIAFVNIGQLVSEILLMQKHIYMTVIDQAFHTETFPYAVIKGNHIVYSKLNTQTHEEEIIFYNMDTKETNVCINENVYKESDLAWSYVIEKTPYIRIDGDFGTQFYNLKTNKVDIKFTENLKVENIVNDLFLVSGKKKSLLGKESHMTYVYRYPDKELIHYEKGEYIGCIATDRHSVYILVK